jgi:amino acid transporter
MATLKKKRFSVRNILIGPAIASEDAQHQAISKKVGLAVFASDALSSVAYATQEILIVLAVAAAVFGAAIYSYSIPIALVIIALLAVLTISYRQTIFAYPGGAGAYLVARDNLGEVPAMTAAAALLMDYVLTVAVSVASGVEQLASAFPDLKVYRIPIAVFIILVITVINLRGVKESGAVFAVPTYFFIGMMLLMLGVGFYRAFIANNLGIVDQNIHSEHLFDYDGVFAMLILRAFSSGCTALTGVEAISDGILAFKDPKSKNAATTLTVMAAILATMFFGITVLANRVQAVPSETPTVISQIAETVFGGGPLYILLIASAMLILMMAANTAFADFPRLGAFAARDGFLPRQMASKGRRLVFSWGIMLLSLAACLLIIVRNARVTELLPLYAVGVFMGFTLSQFSMVKRWLTVSKLKPGETARTLFSEAAYDKDWRWKLAVSAIGGTMTFIVMLVFAISKFTAGAWVVCVVIPALVFLFYKIRQHYINVARMLSMSGRVVNPIKHEMLTLVLVDDVHVGTVPMVEFAMSLRHPWLAVHIDNDAEKTEIIKAKWAERMKLAYHPLVIVKAPYRNLTQVVVEYVQQQLDKMGPKSLVHVVMGQLVMDTYIEQALHSNTTIQFKLALQRMERVVVTDVSYQLHTDEAENYPVNIEQNYKTEHPELVHGNGHGHGGSPQPSAPTTLSGLSPSAELAADEAAKQ